jgi:hypothetical protein
MYIILHMCWLSFPAINCGLTVKQLVESVIKNILNKDGSDCIHFTIHCFDINAYVLLDKFYELI